MMYHDPEGKSFENLGVGPIISIERLDDKQPTMEEMLDRGLMVTAFITDKKHPVFEMFMKRSGVDKDINPVAVFVTAYYLEGYYD